jgi:hypothetical protein
MSRIIHGLNLVEEEEEKVEEEEELNEGRG